ncbi:putative acetyltransferase [Bacillus sp. TS-2]|nr:putative acetyltransferase [Bacillus sp. TS-2]
MAKLNRLFQKIKRNFVGIYKRFKHDLLVNLIGRSFLTTRTVRKLVYRLAGMQVKTNEIRPNCTIIGNQLTLQKGVLINYNVFIDCKELVEIGERTFIAFGVHICTSTHKIGYSEKRAGDATNIPVWIGKGCWIGANATILPGSHIGDGCVIAAGSLVKGECLPNHLYAGVPAQPIKKLP